MGEFELKGLVEELWETENDLKRCESLLAEVFDNLNDLPYNDEWLETWLQRTKTYFNE